MNRYTQFALLSASTLRMLPHIALYLLHRKEIDADLEKYSIYAEHGYPVNHHETFQNTQDAPAYIFG